MFSVVSTKSKLVESSDTERGKARMLKMILLVQATKGRGPGIPVAMRIVNSLGRRTTRLSKIIQFPFS